MISTVNATIEQLSGLAALPAGMDTFEDRVTILIGAGLLQTLALAPPDLNHPAGPLSFPGRRSARQGHGTFRHHRCQ
jgi:hypothetical protein